MNKKRILICFTLFLFAFIFFISANCSSSNHAAKDPQVLSTAGQEIDLTGLLEIQTENGLKNYIIIENPDSKSRKSYILVDLTDNQMIQLDELENQIITAHIKIIEEISPWLFKANLISISQ